MIEDLKVCYFDIDGTLLGKSGKIDQHVLKTIEKLHELKISIGIATGRPWFAAKEVAEQIKTNAPVMSYSGALLTDRETDKTLRSSFLTTEDSKAMLALAKEQGWYIELYSESEYFVTEKNRLSEIHTEYMNKDPIECSLDSLAENTDILKVVLMFEGGPPQDALSQIEKGTGETEIAIAYGASHPDIHFVNITDHTAKREKALSAICENLSCTENQIMAFGDGEADIPFLSTVKWGVAMGNANPAVKEAASYTTSSVEEQGVAEFLNHCINNT